MILLSGQTLTASKRFRPETMSLTLEERKSSASFTMPIDGESISLGNWMQDDCEPGEGIVWRVKNVTNQIETGIRTVQLEHIIQTLRDFVIPGEVKGGQMLETPTTAETCTAKQAIQYALRQTVIDYGNGSSGPMWELGDWGGNGYIVQNPSKPYHFSATTVMDAVESVCATLYDPMWDYDLTSIPFKLHIYNASQGPTVEARLNRNIQSLRVTEDRSRMYTRIYPIGAQDLRLTEGYLENAFNASLYGLVSKIETDQSQETEAELRAWAQARLANHDHPAVTVQISGQDLSQETGEDLDRIRIGYICRVWLYEVSLGTWKNLRITRMQYRDKIADPKSFTATMGDLVEDVASVFSQKTQGTESSLKGSGGRARKKAEEDHAWFVDTTDHVAMVAEAIIGHHEGDDDDAMWSRVSTLVVDGDGIHGRVTATENGIAQHGTSIEQNEKRISLAVGTYAIDPANIIEITAGHDFPQTGQTGKFYLDKRTSPNRMYVWKNGKYMLLELDSSGSEGYLIKAGEIALAINNDGSAEAHIDAQKVILGQSTLTADDLADWAKNPANDANGVFAKYLTVKRLTAQEISTMLADIGTALMDKIWTSNLEVEGQAEITEGLYVSYGLKVRSGDSGSYSTINVADAAVDGNTLKIWLVGDAVGSPSVTFSKATTLEKAWSSGTITVNAKQTNSGTATTVATLSVALSGQLSASGNPVRCSADGTASNSGKYIKRDFLVQYVEPASGGGEDQVISTGLTVTPVINASTLYNAGWDDGLAAIVRSDRAATSQELTIKTLQPGDRWTIIDTKRSSAGTTSETKYTVAAAAGDTYTAALKLGAGIWPTRVTGTNRGTNSVKLVYYGVSTQPFVNDSSGQKRSLTWYYVDNNSGTNYYSGGSSYDYYTVAANNIYYPSDVSGTQYYTKN